MVRGGIFYLCSFSGLFHPVLKQKFTSVAHFIEGLYAINVNCHSMVSKCPTSVEL